MSSSPEYRLVEASSGDTLSERVTALMAEGWIPHGSVQVPVGFGAGFTSWVEFVQPMVRFAAEADEQGGAA